MDELSECGVMAPRGSVAFTAIPFVHTRSVAGAVPHLNRRCFKPGLHGRVRRGWASRITLDVLDEQLHNVRVALA